MSGNEQIELKARPAQETPAAPAPSPEDTGSQALSEALQSSFFLVKILMAGLVVVFLCSGFFIVQPGQQAIKLRFGKPVGEGEQALLGPGFHWAFPRPIDEVTKIPLGQLQEASSTVGWYYTTPELEQQKGPAGPTLNPAIDGYTLTSDANIVHARATMRYRITEPIHYLFDYANAGEFVTNALNNSIFYASSQFSVDEILKYTAFKEAVTRQVNKLVNQQNLGINIDQVDVVVVPPRQLEDQFTKVVQASQQRDDALNKAKSYAVEVSSKARAESESRTNAALAASSRVVSMAEAEAKQFLALQPQYQRNPQFYMQWRQTEALAKVLTNAQDKMFIPKRPDGKPFELRLELSREPERFRTQTPQN